MARYSEQSCEVVDQTVTVGKTACLLDERSLIFGDREGIWSASNVADLHTRLNENQLVGDQAGGTFSTKWAVQLADASDQIRLVAAELVLVHFLFTSSVGAGRKLEIVRDSLEGTGIELPPDALPIRAMDEGVGRPGVGFNTRRDLQIGYLSTS